MTRRLVSPPLPEETVGAALRRAAARLANAGIDQPVREARLLLAHALGVETSALLDTRRVVATDVYDTLVARRAGREPMAHLRGRQGFWTLDLVVSSATLIPRADSETLVTALRDLAPPDLSRVLDLGTGTGALLLSALALFPNAWGAGVDRSTDALAVARTNARANGMSDRAVFLAGDWAAAIVGRFGAVLCNPPYVRRAEIPNLMPEVARHDPRAALDGGPDGLDAYRAVIPALAGIVDVGGLAILEIGADQAVSVIQMARACGHELVDLRHDLGGNARAVVLRSTIG